MTYNPFSTLYRTFPATIDPDNTENSMATQMPKTVLFDILERLKALEANPGAGTTPGAGGAAVWGSITGDLQNQTDLYNKLATKAEASAVNAELTNKADKSTVDAELTKKADSATVILELANKADVSTTTAELNKKADKTTVDEALAKKADAITVNSALTAKADSITVTTELGKKADKTIVDRILNDDGGYTDKAYVNMFVNSKVNPLRVQKADTVTVEAALAKKADTTTVNDALAKKANTETVEASLATKAEANTVTTELAKKANNFTVDGDTLTMSSNRVLTAKPGKHYGVVTDPYDFDVLPDSDVQFLTVPDKRLLINAPFNVLPATNITIQSTKFSNEHVTWVVQTVTATADTIVSTYTRFSEYYRESGKLTGSWKVNDNYTGVTRGLNIGRAFKSDSGIDSRFMFASTNLQDDHYKETFELLRGSFVKSKKYGFTFENGVPKYTEYEFVLTLKNTVVSDTEVKPDDYQYKITLNDDATAFFADGKFWDSGEASPSYATVLYGNSTLTFHIESDKTLVLTSHGAIGKAMANKTMTVNFKIFVSL